MHSLEQVKPCCQMASESLPNPPRMKIRSCRYNFQFEIDYSKSKDLPMEACVSSPTFTAGGYDWSLVYYPQGCDSEYEGSHATLFLILESDANDIFAQFSFELLGKNGKLDKIYNSDIEIFAEYSYCLGPVKFIPRDKIEELYCMKGILVISCNIRVLNPSVVKKYPGGLCEHIEKFWEKEKRFDVTFEVEGESIPAHRFMLAARSPVFEAKLFGSMAEANMECIKIDEMKAEVFKALIHFIYLDQLTLDESSDVQRDDGTISVDFLWDLFVAADRYALDKLALLCEEQLERALSIDTVAAALILADQHSHTSLKEKCLKFASAQENFSLVALTNGYLQIMQSYPTLFVELSEKVKASAALTKFAKKQKTSY